MDNDVQSPEAVQALADRGVNNPHRLLEHGTPAEILACCHRWDRQRGVSPGLLVRWIIDGRFDEPEQPAPKVDRNAQLRARFAQYAERYPVGAIVETHRQLVARRWLEDLDVDRFACSGQMVVADASYPVLELECNNPRCGFLAALGPRHLHVLGQTPEPSREEAWPF